MPRKKIALHSEKQYELGAIKYRIKEEFDKFNFKNIEFKNDVLREFGDTKTLLLIYESWFFRTGSYAGLVIMLSEFQGYQTADIIATGGKEIFFSFGAENELEKCGVKALKNIGFKERDSWFINDKAKAVITNLTCPKCKKSHDIDYPKCPGCKYNYK